MHVHFPQESFFSTQWSNIFVVGRCSIANHINMRMTDVVPEHMISLLFEVDRVFASQNQVITAQIQMSKWLSQFC